MEGRRALSHFNYLLLEVEAFLRALIVYQLASFRLRGGISGTGCIQKVK